MYQNEHNFRCVHDSVTKCDTNMSTNSVTYLRDEDLFWKWNRSNHVPPPPLHPSTPQRGTRRLTCWCIVKFAVTSKPVVVCILFIGASISATLWSNYFSWLCVNVTGSLVVTSVIHYLPPKCVLSSRTVSSSNIT